MGYFDIYDGTTFKGEIEAMASAIARLAFPRLYMCPCNEDFVKRYSSWAVQSAADAVCIDCEGPGPLFPVDKTTEADYTLDAIKWMLMAKWEWIDKSQGEPFRIGIYNQPYRWYMNHWARNLPKDPFGYAFDSKLLGYCSWGFPQFYKPPTITPAAWAENVSTELEAARRVFNRKIIVIINAVEVIDQQPAQIPIGRDMCEWMLVFLAKSRLCDGAALYCHAPELVYSDDMGFIQAARTVKKHFGS